MSDLTITVEGEVLAGRSYAVRLSRHLHDAEYQAVRDYLAREHPGSKFLLLADDVELTDTTVDGSTSDGFHTFDELYDHRAALFAALCRAHPGLAWRSRRHHEGGDPMFPGFFIAGLAWQTMQVSYHVREECWDWFDTVDVLEHAPTWDGHAPADVITRLNGWQTPGQIWGAMPQRARPDAGSGLIMSIGPTEPPQPVEIGAYDATGSLIARTTVGADGVLAEPLHVPAGGMVYAVGWPVAIPLGSSSAITRTVPLRPEGGQPVSEPAAVEPGEAERLLAALTDDCHGSCAHEGVGGECLCTSVFFPAIAALRGGDVR